MFPCFRPRGSRLAPLTSSPAALSGFIHRAKQEIHDIYNLYGSSLISVGANKLPGQHPAGNIIEPALEAWRMFCPGHRVRST